MSHMSMGHGTHVNESDITCININTCHAVRCHPAEQSPAVKMCVTHINKPCDVHQRVMSHISMTHSHISMRSHVTYINDSRQTHQWVLPCMIGWMEQVISHETMRRVTQIQKQQRDAIHRDTNVCEGGDVCE